MSIGIQMPKCQDHSLAYYLSHLGFGLDLPAIALARLPRKALASG
jgi:hypothetical protein